MTTETISLAITGASGATYGLRLLECLTLRIKDVDFELNQAAAPAGNCVITRTEGDILIAYRFPGGASEPDIDAYRWVPHAVPTTQEDGTWDDIYIKWFES